ncbi:MAG: cupin domain-containing protein [Haloarculaceae archaeon]
MPDVVSLSDLDATPHAEVFADRPRTVRLSLAAGESMPAHSHPGDDVLFHVLSGEIELSLDGDPHSLGAGDLVRFDGARQIEPRAVDDATALVVFAPA